MLWSTPAIDGRAARFCPHGSTPHRRVTMLDTPFQPSPARITSRRPTLSSSYKRPQTNDSRRIYRPSTGWGAAADLLSLGHEKMAETTGVGLIDNLMERNQYRRLMATWISTIPRNSWSMT